MAKKKTVTERSLTPLCIRFRPQDLEAVRIAAAKQMTGGTIFIREAVMMRVVAIEEELDLPKLTFASDGTLSEPISVRFRPSDYRRAARAATREGVPLSLWARAISIEYVQRLQTPKPRQAAVGE